MNLEKKELAVSSFLRGYTCTQGLFLVYYEKVGIEYDLALKIGTAFGSGLGCMGETCGVVVGAIILIGVKYGQTKLEHQQAKDTTYYLVQEFLERFRSRNQFITCKKLIGCDLSTPEGAKLDRDNNISYTLCPKFIEDTIEILDEIFKSENSR